VVPGTTRFETFVRLSVCVPSTQNCWTPPLVRRFRRCTTRTQTPAPMKPMSGLPPLGLACMYIRLLRPIQFSIHGPSGFSGDHCWYVMLLSSNAQFEGTRMTLP
jgi:hypothetical protein